MTPNIHLHVSGKIVPIGNVIDFQSLWNAAVKYARTKDVKLFWNGLFSVYLFFVLVFGGSFRLNQHSVI